MGIIMKKINFKIIFLVFTFFIILTCTSFASASNDMDANPTMSENTDNVITTENGINEERHSQLKIINKTSEDNPTTKESNSKTAVNLTINSVPDTEYTKYVNIYGKISTENNKMPQKANILTYIDNSRVTNNNLTLENNGNFRYLTSQMPGTYTFKIVVSDEDFEYKSQSTKFKTTGKVYELLDKYRPIYFAMDHTSSKDYAIRNTIVNKLKSEGFNVVRYTIGPNAMYSNMVYLYNHNIRNAIMFHLFNGVDPSNIREVATNGNDNRGRIVRSRGNDVVLAWFYDSADPVHVGGSCYYSVRGSETGGRLYYPKLYMDRNDIYAICTSSDNYAHKSTADYTGELTSIEFMRLFKGYTDYKYNPTMKSSYTMLNSSTVNFMGTVTYNSKTINGYVTIKQSDGKILEDNIVVKNNAFNTKLSFTTSGNYNITVQFKPTNLYNSCNNTFRIPIVTRNSTIIITQPTKIINNNSVKITLKDSKNGTLLNNKRVFVSYPNNNGVSYLTDENGSVIINTNYKSSQSLKISTYDEYYNIMNSTTYDVVVDKIPAVVSVENITGVIGEKITLKANVQDHNGNPINGGNLVFKVNGKTLRSDGRFDSDAPSLKLSVKKGVVTYELTADAYLRNSKIITAIYSGTYDYMKSTSDVAKISLTKRYAGLTVSTNPAMAKQYQSITFIVRVNDITPNSENSLINDRGYIIFKINGVTLKDSNNNKLLVPVRNNIATYTYRIPNGMGGITNNQTLRDYELAAIFTNDNYYPGARNTSSFNVERSGISIDFGNIEVRNNTLNINATIKDYMGNKVIGKNKIAVKVNGITLTDSNNRTLYLTVNDGAVNLDNIKIPDNINVKRVMLVTGERQAYLGGRNETAEIIKY